MTNSKEAILTRLLDRVSDVYDKTEGSFHYDFMSANASEFEILFERAAEVLRLAFARTTKGIYLAYRTEEHGVIKKEAEAATGVLTITGDPGAVISASSLFATPGGREFTTDTEATISAGGTVAATITAKVKGTAGNVPAERITVIPISIPGVTEVINAEPMTGGVNEESDEALLDRYLDKVLHPATSGNAFHYQQWAKEVSGVGDAKPYPLWAGNGTVKVCIVNDEKRPADAQIVTNTAEYIEEHRPIGATVTVGSAAGLGIDVMATVILDTGATLAGVQTLFEAALAEYLASIVFKQNFVSFAKIGGILLGIPGIVDYSGLAVNGGTVNVPVDDTAAGCQAPIVGVVMLSE